MTNRFFILLTVCSLIFGGCPSPDSEDRNRAFDGKLLFTAQGVIQQMDLKSGVITVLAEGSAPFETAAQTIGAVHKELGLVEYADNATTRRVIVQKDMTNTDPHDDGFADPQHRSGRIAYHFGGRSYVVSAVSGALIHDIDDAVRPIWLDDTKLLIQREAVLYSYNLTNGQSIRLADEQGRDHTLSPDGSRIAFVDNKDLFVMNVDGSNLKLIMSGYTELRYPVWSQDGTHIIVKDGCDLKLFKVTGGMVQSFKGRYFSFTDAHCPEASQLSWQ